MTIATGYSHGTALAEAFGIPTRGLRRFTLHVARNEVIQVRAVYAVLEEGAGECGPRYRRGTHQALAAARRRRVRAEGPAA